MINPNMMQGNQNQQRMALPQIPQNRPTLMQNVQQQMNPNIQGIQSPMVGQSMIAQQPQQQAAPPPPYPEPPPPYPGQSITGQTQVIQALLISSVFQTFFGVSFHDFLNIRRTTRVANLFFDFSKLHAFK